MFFLDGNKRTGFASAARFLDVNGFAFNAGNDEVEQFVLQIAKEKLDLKMIAAWFNCQPESRR